MSTTPVPTTITPPTAPRKYRLRAGKHTQKEPVRDSEGNPVVDDKGRVVMGLATYGRGDIFWSNHNLLKFNARDGLKFELVEDQPRVQPQSTQALNRPPVLTKDPSISSVSLAPASPGTARSPVEVSVTDPYLSELTSMTDDQLKQLAADEEVDVRGVTDRGQLLKILAAAQAAGVRPKAPTMAKTPEAATRPEQGQTQANATAQQKRK